MLVLFFQAEDAIRAYKVTGVQTCALPIWVRGARVAARRRRHSRAAVARGVAAPARARAAAGDRRWARRGAPAGPRAGPASSEERRVGKEWRARSAPRPRVPGAGGEQ